MGPGAVDTAEASADAIEAAVVRRITPDEPTVERLRQAREHLLERARAAAAARKSPVARCLIAGSAARSTFLADRLDIDLFLLFPTSLDRARLESEGLALAADLLQEPETRYAEHPYLRGRFEGFPVDAVPGYQVDDPSHPMSAVDRTPFHQAYLEARATPTTPREVRLTKQFLRGIGAYGSEARTAGFSGYLVELLVLKFGGFRPLLGAARRWRLPVRLAHDPTARPVVPDDVALVLDDPVDPHRNVATALSRRNLSLFILAASAYLDAPSARFFEPTVAPRLSLATARERLTERGSHVAILRLPRPRLVDDILYPQLRKAERATAATALRLGFHVLGTASGVGESSLVLLLEVADPSLGALALHEGPPAGIDRGAEFVRKWTSSEARVLQGPYVDEGGRLAVELHRAERALEPLLTRSLADLPIGRDLKEALPREARFEPISEAIATPELERALGELLLKRLPWLEPSRP